MKLGHKYFLFSVSFILLMWLTVLIVDIFSWISTDGKIFIYIFDNGKYVEIAQWVNLSVACVTSAIIFSIYRYLGDRDLSIFWILMSIAFVLMLLEDAGDIRHTIAADVHQVVGRSFTRPVEMLWFSFIASVPLAAIFIYGSWLKKMNNISTFFILGFLFYGVASFMSFSSNFGDWYNIIGGNIAGAVGMDPSLFGGRIGFWLMDALVEESIEYAGAVCFATSCILQLQSLYDLN